MLSSLNYELYSEKEYNSNPHIKRDPVLFKGTLTKDSVIENGFNNKIAYIKLEEIVMQCHIILYY